MKYYCGPYYFPKWIKKIVGYRFNESCRIHDLDYNSQDISRKEIDLMFLDNMLRSSITIRDVITAYIFYYTVRIFGWISWNKPKK